MRYRIYYGDGGTFTTPDEGDVSQAPVEGVQAIAWEDPDQTYRGTGRFLLDSWDFYLYSTVIDSWVGTNKYHDVIRHVQKGIAAGSPIKALLLGEWIARDDFEVILRRAKTDDLCPDITARHVGERGIA